MKQSSIKIPVLISILFASSIYPMSCKLKFIKNTTETVLQKICDIDFSIPDIQLTQIDDLIAQVSATQELLCSKIDELSVVENLVMCQAITSPTTIMQAGSYCVSADIAGSITIDADNVCLDLNGHEISSGIVVTTGHDQINIKNGAVVGGSPAILVNVGVTNIIIENVTCKNATCGIQFENVTGGAIEHCTLTQNSTGLCLNNSYDVKVFDTVARANRYAGFDLLQSSTNCLVECKAFSTGQDNAQISGEVFGFVAKDGYANIFERCIANDTQALANVAGDSVIAGFALKGNEGCSKIINCESANSQTSENGFALPYGIWLEPQVSSLTTLTAFSQAGDAKFDFPSWSPDGAYFAITESKVAAVHVFAYDASLQVVTLVATAQFDDPSQGADDYFTSLQWSADGSLIAVAGRESTTNTFNLQLFRFDRANNTLSFFGGDLIVDSAEGIRLHFSHDGRYLVAGDNGSAPNLLTYKIDAIKQTVERFQETDISRANFVRWSPDDSFVVTGNFDILRMLEFDSTATFMPIASTVSIASFDAAWTPNGKYVAVTTFQGFTADGISLYEFDETSKALSEILVVEDFSSFVSNLNWTPDGRYLFAPAFISAGPATKFLMYEFIPTTTLQLIKEVDFTFSVPVTSLHPAGDVAILGVNESGGQVNNGLFVISTFDFPSKNVISNNTVYCNSGNQCPEGIGISGSSLSNMIIGNTAYNNPNNPFMVSSNYAYVANVFNSLFGNAPSDLQNISLDGCQPINLPDDLALILKQIKYKLTNVFPSLVDVAASTISIADTPCQPITISSAQEIAQEGIYCLSQDVSGDMLITGNNVLLDLNNHRIDGSVSITANNATLKNGVVENGSSGDGVSVSGGVENVTIERVLVKNAIRGINFENVHNSTINNCTLAQNATGLELDSSYKIVVDNTIAECNRNAGFCLLSSYTNCFTDCKALSTGENNNVVFENSVVGFVSTNGYGNVFERCIANATHALSTTDSNSLIAGFALRGSEGCSKIIGCESANATASSEGVAVPYGILLEASLGSISSITAWQVSGGLDFVFTVDWSPDGLYLAVGIESGTAADPDLHIYRFDRVASSLLKVDSTVVEADSDLVNSVKWSPDGLYLAVGITSGTSADPDLHIYKFDRSNGELKDKISVVVAADSDKVLTVDWSLDGLYLAVGIESGASADPDLHIYRFDRVANSLSKVTSVVVQDNADLVNSVKWSPDGLYLAVGITSGTSADPDLHIYRFDRSNGELKDKISVVVAADSDQVFTVDWSPNGLYLAVGITSGMGADPDLHIYRFDRDTNTLTALLSVVVEDTSDIIHSVNWSDNGEYLAVGLFNIGLGLPDLFIYRFDRSSNSLEQVAVVTVDNGLDQVYSAKWSPDGAYLAVGIRSIDSN